MAFVCHLQATTKKTLQQQERVCNSKKWAAPVPGFPKLSDYQVAPTSHWTEMVVTLFSLLNTSSCKLNSLQQHQSLQHQLPSRRRQWATVPYCMVRGPCVLRHRVQPRQSPLVTRSKMLRGHRDNYRSLPWSPVPAMYSSPSATVLYPWARHTWMYIMKQEAGTIGTPATPVIYRTYRLIRWVWEL